MCIRDRYQRRVRGSFARRHCCLGTVERFHTLIAWRMSEADQGILPSVKAIIILDDDGARITSKYFTNDEDSEKQTAFETLLFNKTSRLTTPRHDVDIMMLENQIVVFFFVSDVLFYVVGHPNDNELVLEAVLSGLVETLQILLEQVEKITMLERLELTILAIDEIVDTGMILEVDPNVIAGRVSMHDACIETPLAEQSLSQVMAAAREQMTRALLQ
eukprot:TRINITY_DN46_c0_g1_i1.p2 TRINITY_DN46_c0_g1~~TRINITY_DN46_c0_g1_i1.p2  ORF type:complete len:217 (-),score=66.98 TRINITY_DN46_c0_g1_i1:156-806(-)